MIAWTARWSSIIFSLIGIWLNWDPPPSGNNAPNGTWLWLGAREGGAWYARPGAAPAVLLRKNESHDYKKKFVKFIKDHYLNSTDIYIQWIYVCTQVKKVWCTTNHMYTVGILKPCIVHFFYIRTGTAIQKRLSSYPAVIFPNWFSNHHLCGPRQGMAPHQPWYKSFWPTHAWCKGGQRTKYCPCLIHFYLYQTMLTLC